MSLHIEAAYASTKPNKTKTELANPLLCYGICIETSRNVTIIAAFAAFAGIHIFFIYIHIRDIYMLQSCNSCTRVKNSIPKTYCGYCEPFGIRKIVKKNLSRFELVIESIKSPE